MSLEDLKISDSDVSEYGVVAAPDRLTGNAQENKKVFDRLIRACVAAKFNALIDRLLGGAMLPAGGSKGQVLTKQSAEDGDAEWQSVESAVAPVKGKDYFTDEEIAAIVEQAAKEATEKVLESIGESSGESCDCEPYTLPTATTDTLGGIKLGDGLTIDKNGVVSVLLTEDALADGDVVSY